jgi:hypothetical protein
MGRRQHRQRTVRSPDKQARGKTYYEFPVQLTGDYVSHVIDWRTDRIYFQMIHGHHSFCP